jgi:hypothetical protein
MEWLIGILIASVFLILRPVIKTENLLLIRINKLHNSKTLIILHIFIYSIIFLVACLSIRFVFNRYLRCPPHAYYDENAQTKDGCVLDAK